MVKATYIWRIDDVCPGMDKKKFDRYIELFKSYDVIPVIGLVPENKDASLIVDSQEYDFWAHIVSLKKNGVVDIAQHGYQHLLHKSDTAILNKDFGFNGLSEFSGLSYEDQYEKINAGKEILKYYNLHSDIWIAPAHSFDNNTLLALKNCGFKYISDGIGLWPFKYCDLWFVPQQIWKPRKMPFGCWSICLHLNDSTDEDFKKISDFLSQEVKSIRFEHALMYSSSFLLRIGNYFFKYMYLIANKLKRGC